MTPNEKSLIEDLFSRLRTANTGPRDTDAEQAIAAEMARSPGVAYAMVQTVLVQDQALREANDKIQAAQQQQPAPSFLDRAGSAFSGLGGARPAQQPSPAQQPFEQYSAAPQAAAPQGGFMRGALQTAAGVASGALLFEGVRSLFGGGGGLGGFGGGGPWGGGGTTVNETVINEAPDNDRATDARDDNIQDASYDTSDNDDGGYDDGSSGSSDDSWV